ncbi:hypothetical protein PGT21_007795 [Puccinia graminis f. sp. tritici]|uniref:Uncharacterized protein n=1 Tax=Puccinia graminis f. sp. tritici TaxID=56615 RepID=A0A5B0QMC7_PUCGR|nr:hypothetical protein PGT21_007795 [Puccinia graminis f. sp. tritici]
MPPRLVFFLACRLLTCSTLLHVGFSSPIQNVQVVPLANNGEAISSVVLPSGTSSSKSKIALESGTNGKPVSLIEKGDKGLDNKTIPLDFSTSSSRLVNAEKDSSTSPEKKTNVTNGTQDQIVKLIERPSNGKSFFADQTTTAPTPKPEESLVDKKKTNPTGLGGEPQHKENSGESTAVKLLSEKPLVTSPSSDDEKEKKTAEGKVPIEPKGDSLASRLSSAGKEDPLPKKPPTEGFPPKPTDDPKAPKDPKTAGEKIKSDESKAPIEPKPKEAVPGKKDGGEGSKKPDVTEVNKGQLGKDPKVEPPKPKETSLLEKDLKPLSEKPTSKDETQESPVLLSLGQKTEDETKEPEFQAGLAEKKMGTDKDSRPQNDAEGVNKKKKADGQGKETPKEDSEIKPPTSLPTVDSAKDLGPEPAPKAPPPLPPKSTVPPPPPLGKGTAEPDPPVTKDSFPEAQSMRLAGNTANTLSVVKEGSTSTANQDSGGPKDKEGEDKSMSKLIYIGAGGVGLLILLVIIIIFSRKKQKKEKQSPDGEKSWGVQSEVPIEFGSGQGASQITTPLSPPMSLNGKSQRGIPVALPTPRGDEDLSGGKSFSRQLRYSNGSERNNSTRYESDYGRDVYGQDSFSAYNESDFYDNSRYKGSRDPEPRGRVDSFPIQRSTGQMSPRSERGRFPYNRR